MADEVGRLVVPAGAYTDPEFRLRVLDVLRQMPGGLPIADPVVPSVTTLPTGAARHEGREIDYWPSGTAGSGPLWRLVWRGAANSGSGAWECVSGAPLYSHVGGKKAWSAPGTAYTWTAITGGPSITIPVTGTYDVRYGASGQLETNTSRWDERLVVFRDTTNIASVGASLGASASAFAQWAFVNWNAELVSTAMAATNVLTLRRLSSESSAAGWGMYDMVISVTPLELRP